MTPLYHRRPERSPQAWMTHPRRREKRRNIHRALDAGWGRVVTIVAIVSLDWFQAQSIWEMSA